MKLVAITTVYGLHHLALQAVNYRRCADSLRAQGIDLWTVEGLFPGQYAHTSGDRGIPVDLQDLLWHKERLLQIGVEQLPDDVDAVLWLDADVMFELPNIRERIEQSLSDYVVCQPWSQSLYYDEAGRPINGVFDVRQRGGDQFSAWAIEVPLFLRRSMASMNLGKLPTTNPSKSHPGLAWAARRELLADVGFYQCNMGGAGDVTMCEGFWGRREGLVREQYSGPQWPHVVGYVTDCFAAVRGNVGCVEGTIRHLWHGSLRTRRYRERIAALIASEFDPGQHLVCEPGQALRWAADAPAELVSWMRRYLGGV